MSKANLEFVIDVEADETLLRTVRDSLTETDSPLAQTLLKAIQETISEAIGSELEAIKLPSERVSVQTKLHSGLNAQEWMNDLSTPTKSDPTTTPAIKEEIKEQGFQD